MSGKDRGHVSEAFFRFRDAFSHMGDGSSGLLFVCCSQTSFCTIPNQILLNKLQSMFDRGNLFCQETGMLSMDFSQSNLGELKSWQNYLL